MAYSERLYLPGYPYHVVQRGNNRQQVFMAPSDYIRYQDYLHDALLRYGVFCHAFVQMSNHVHLLLTPGCAGGISRVMSLLGNRYVQVFNHRHGRSGTLWEGRHHAGMIVSDKRFWATHLYIELNPVRAGIVTHPDGYYWSSYAHNALGVHSDLVSPHTLYEALAEDRRKRLTAYRHLFQERFNAAEFDEIRRVTRRDSPLEK